MNININLPLISSSKKLAKLPFIEVLLGNQVLYKTLPIRDLKVAAFIGWGRRPSSEKLRKKAIRQTLPFIALEDGFLRSYGTGNYFPGLSLVIDYLGIYYDSTQSNELEFLLASNIDLLENRKFLQNLKPLMKSNALSKYNHAPNMSLSFLNFNDLNRVLVIDQTEGDMSVIYGDANHQTFLEMLTAAISENPTATIYVKTHPEVTSRRKKGYLTHIQDSARIVMIRQNVNPIDLIKRMDKVYVVTSQMGFEALMCGKSVVCFGVPWYSGWGLTDDRVKDSPAWARRTKKRTVEELFAAAYIHYTRYLNPFMHKRGNIMDIINWLILQKKMVAEPFSRNFN